MSTKQKEPKWVFENTCCLEVAELGLGVDRNGLFELVAFGWVRLRAARDSELLEIRVPDIDVVHARAQRERWKTSVGPWGQRLTDGSDPMDLVEALIV